MSAREMTARTRTSTTETVFTIQGLDCAVCAESLAAGLRATPGIQAATVNFAAGSARVIYEPERVDAERVNARIRALGYASISDDQPAAAWEFTVSGMDCADCARSIEAMVAGLPGVASATLNFGAAILRVAPAPSNPVSAAAISTAVARAGYGALPRQAARTVVKTQPLWRDRRLLPVLIATALWIVATVAEHTAAPRWSCIAIFAAAIALGGWTFARAGWYALLARRLDMNVLMTVSVIGAALLGDWSEGAMVVILFSLGGALQSLTLERTRGAIRSLMDLTPATATLLRDGFEEIVPVTVLRVQDQVRVRPGERIPADGFILEGASAIDQAAITGESIPVDKLAGDIVYAGSMNGPGALTVTVSRPAEDSTIARIIHLVEEAQGSKAPSQQLIDRFASVYTPLVLVFAAVIAGVGAWVLGDPDTWVYRALVMLVIACPCALVISTPVSIVSAIGAATRRGLLVKGGAALEIAGTIKAAVFDKTGTLTQGKPAVTSLHPAETESEESLLALASAVEAFSEHPLARAVIAYARHTGTAIPAARDFVAEPGLGARATVGDRSVAVSSVRRARELNAFDANEIGVTLATLGEELSRTGQTVLVVTEQHSPGVNIVLGLIAVADAPRPEARAALTRLRAAGIEHIAVMTGDNAATAAAIASAVGADSVLADMLPADKAAAISRLQARYGPVLMAGDGVNDAPALAVADAGIAMGLGGTDVALETADMALMNDDLNGVADAVLLSRATTRIIRQNIALSLGIKAIALVLGLFGFVGLWIAVIADMGTSLLVTANAMRLARWSRPERGIPHDAWSSGGLPGADGANP